MNTLLDKRDDITVNLEWRGIHKSCLVFIYIGNKVAQVSRHVDLTPDEAIMRALDNLADAIEQKEKA